MLGSLDGLFVFLGGLDIAFDQRGVFVGPVGIAFRNKEGRGLLNAVGLGEFPVADGVDLPIGDAFAVKKHLGGLAVGTGRGGEEHELGDLRRLFLLRLAAAFATVANGDFGMLIVLVDVGFPHLEFLHLTRVPVLHGAIVAGYTGIDLGFLAAVGAFPLFTD